MGFPEACFNDTDDDIIDQALKPADSARNRSWFDGIDRERLEREGHVELLLPTSPDGHVLPFSTPDWFRTPHGRAELLPIPVFTAPAESRHSPAAREYPLEFLPRKADNYMNSTFANLEGHQKLEKRTEGALEIHSDDARARNISTGDVVEVFNGRGRIHL